MIAALSKRLLPNRGTLQVLLALAALWILSCNAVKHDPLNVLGLKIDFDHPHLMYEGNEGKFLFHDDSMVCPWDKADAKDVYSDTRGNLAVRIDVYMKEEKLVGIRVDLSSTDSVLMNTAMVEIERQARSKSYALDKKSFSFHDISGTHTGTLFIGREHVSSNYAHERHLVPLP